MLGFKRFYILFDISTKEKIIKKLWLTIKIVGFNEKVRKFEKINFKFKIWLNSLQKKNIHLNLNFISCNFTLFVLFKQNNVHFDK